MPKEDRPAPSEKREYKTEQAARAQKTRWEAKGYSVFRRKNTLYLKKPGEDTPAPEPLTPAATTNRRGPGRPPGRKSKKR